MVINIQLLNLPSTNSNVNATCDISVLMLRARLECGWFWAGLGQTELWLGLAFFGPRTRLSGTVQNKPNSHICLHRGSTSC